MTVIGNRGIGLVLLIVGVFTVGLFLFATPAEAHGAHAPSIEVVEVEAKTDDAAHGHLGHCHGGAFCPAAAVFSLVPAVSKPIMRGARFARPEPSTATTASTTFDPPPPRVLI